MNIFHYFLILILMFFLHIVDDYYFQGILASLKQKSWWEEHAPGKLYQNDYKIALFEHAFSWSFVISLPWLVINFINYNLGLSLMLIAFYIFNTCTHALIDNLKANAKIINLIEDQCAHFIQIFITWLLLTLIYII